MAPDEALASTPFPLTALDREILSMSDDDFHPHTWEELKQIIGMIGIISFSYSTRTPSRLTELS